MTSTLSNLRQFVFLFSEFFITLILKKIIKIIIITWLVLNLAINITEAAEDNSFTQKINNTFTQLNQVFYNFFTLDYYQNDLDDMTNLFITQFNEILLKDNNINNLEPEKLEADNKLIKKYFNNDMTEKDLKNLNYNILINNKIYLTDVIINAKRLSQASQINLDTVNNVLETEIYTNEKDPLEGIITLLNLMEDYINIEKSILIMLYPDWEKESNNITIKSVKKAIKQIQEYNQFVKDFALENDFEYQTFKTYELSQYSKDYPGISLMKYYQNIQKEVAQELGIEYNEDLFQNLSGLEKLQEYEKMQNKYQ